VDEEAAVIRDAEHRCPRGSPAVGSAILTYCGSAGKVNWLTEGISEAVVTEHINTGVPQARSAVVMVTSAVTARDPTP
jgi:hypothetical protein